MGNYVGRHYQAPGGTKGLEPSHVVNENTKLVIDANTDPTTNGMVSASLEKYFNTIATTNLPRDYNLNSGKFFLRQPDDGLSTMPTYVSSSNGTASYWEFDGNTNALTATTAFGTEANFGENFSTGTTISFWLKESPMSPSGSQYDWNQTLGDEKQRATLFGMDSTAHEFTQDQRALLVRQGVTTYTSAVNPREIRILNNISGHKAYSAANGATASLSYFEFSYPNPNGTNAQTSAEATNAPFGTRKFFHESNPNPNASSSYSGRTSTTSDAGYDRTFDFNILGEWGSGKGPESGSYLKCLYTTTAGAGATNLELNFKVSCSSNQNTFNDFTGEGEGSRDGDTAKVWLDHSDSVTSASLETMRKLSGNNGQVDDIYSFALNSGENRTSLYRNEYLDLTSGSFRSGSDGNLDGSKNANAPWVNMTFVSEGIISTSLDLTLQVLSGSGNSPEPGGDNMSGSAPYVPAHSATASKQPVGTIMPLVVGRSEAFDEPPFVDGLKFSQADNETTVYGNEYSDQTGEPGVNNGPGFLVGRRNLNTYDSGSFSGGVSGSVDTDSLNYWKAHEGKDLEVWTKNGDDNKFIYKGKHKILSVVEQTISGSIAGGEYQNTAAFENIRQMGEGFVSVRIGGQFDTQGIMGVNQSPGKKRQTFGSDTQPQEVRLRVSSTIGTKHKVYKDGELFQTFDNKGYVIQSGSADNGYLVPFQPWGDKNHEPHQHASWTGSIGESGTSGSTQRRHDGDLIIGRSTGATPKYWRGKVAHFSVYNQALHSADVKGNYYALKSRFDGK